MQDLGVFWGESDPNVVFSTLHTIIPVNCHKITEATSPINQTGNDVLSFLPVKHHSQIGFKFQKHGGVYAVSVFVDVFIFVSNVHIHAVLLAHRPHYTTSNWTTQHRVSALSASECYDWPRAVEILDWPGVDVLCQCVLNWYVLIPVIFILHSHRADYRQFTGNVSASHTGKLPEQI